MDCFEYIFNIYNIFINIAEDLHIEAIDTLNEYGGF